MTPRPEPRTPLASQLLSLLRGLCRPGNPIALPGDRAQRAVAPAPGVALGRNAPPAVLTHGALVSEARTLGLIVERDGQIGVTAAGKAYAFHDLKTALGADVAPAAAGSSQTRGARRRAAPPALPPGAATTAQWAVCR